MLGAKQLAKLSLPAGRYRTMRPDGLQLGVSILDDETPDEPEDLIEVMKVGGAAEAEDDEPGVEMPEPFEFDEKLED